MSENSSQLKSMKLTSVSRFSNTAEGKAKIREALKDRWEELEEERQHLDDQIFQIEEEEEAFEAYIETLETLETEDKNQAEDEDYWAHYPDADWEIDTAGSETDEEAPVAKKIRLSS